MSADPAPPRVLMLGMGWFPATLGGLDRYYRSLLEQLPEARGVVVGPAPDAPASVAVVARHDLPLGRRLLRFWLAARRVSCDVEVLDAHFALYAAAPLLLGAARRRPRVFHFHGPWAEESVAAGDVSAVRRALRQGLEGLVLRSADAHVVLSGAFRRILVERYGVRPWDIHVWPPGVALERFTPGDRAGARARLGIDRTAFVAVCARRLVPRMGIDDLLSAWAAIAADLPAGSVLLLVGDGPLRDSLQARAERPPLAGRVRILGRLSDADLIDAYRAADIAAVPTLAVEGFGLVVLEAAACGTPSIVTDVGGLPEAIRPLDPSLVLPAADIDALATRLRAAARGALPTRTATRNYAERFDWPAVAARHRALHRRLLEGARDPRPRVVYLDHVARLSGGEIALLRVLPHLHRVNAHVILAEHGPLVARLQQAGVSVEVLPIAAAAREVRKDTVRLAGAAPSAMLQTAAYVVRLALRLRRLRPDIVHTNSLKAGVYGSLAANLAGVPVVWHLRDRIADDYLPRPAVRLVRRLIRHLADGVIANSTATLQTLSDADRGRVHSVIPDSVEPSPYPRKADPRPTTSAMATDPRPTTFGMVGRIAPWKGQDLFLQAFAAAFPTGEERAVLVGSPLFGEEDFERSLRDLGERLGLNGRLELRGFREDVWRELAGFDVLVHASVIPEPFGQVVLEGMAAGLPVIAPDEGGPATLIHDGETGRLFRSRDPDALAAAMRSLRDDRCAREGLGSAARRASADYHPADVAGQVEQLYERILRQRRRGPTRHASRR
jgi:glycosyltransferase involved in cell wall biosynthesis